MKIQIFLIILSIFFITGVRADTGCFPPDSPICGGGGGDFNIFIEGCAGDGALCGSCARTTIGYCECNGEGVIIPDCRGPLDDGECASTCDTSSGYYCNLDSADGGNCESEGVGECDELPNNWDECVAGLGCYLDNSSCVNCPSPGDKLCSEYDNQKSCTFDICGLGTQGPDSYICQSEDIKDCGCYWDGDSCEFGYMRFDGENESFCQLEQTFLEEECNPETNKRTLQTTEVCVGLAPNPLGTKEIDCGRALSPLPFFGLLSIISSLIIISFYYFLKNNYYTSKK